MNALTLKPTLLDSIPPFHKFIDLRVDWAKITEVACYVLQKFGQALVINLSIRIAFGVFLVQQATVIESVVILSLTVWIVIKLAQYFFQGKEIPLLFNSIARSTFVTSLTFKLNNYIHEYGHVLGAYFSFIDSKPEVFANYNEGSTSYIISNGLTRFGQFLGEQRARLFVTAAGLTSPIFFTMAEFAIAHGIIDSYPNLSEILVDHGFSQLAHAAYYGLSSFVAYEGQLENDFIQLWQLGDIHPFVSITLMLAIPLAEICLLKYCDKNRNGAAANV